MHFLTALRQVDPSLIAIDRQTTFGDLWRDLEEQARALKHAGIEPGDVVAVDLAASPRAIVGLLAIWRVGAIYLPLAQDWPAARKAFVLRDADVRLVIGEHPLPPRAASVTPALPSIESLSTDLASHLIYTSGSTGAPKGVLVSHRALVSVLRAQIEELGLGPGKRSLLLLSLAFDASLSDIGTSLLSGSTLVVPPSGLLRDPDLLLCTLERERITHVDLPPAIVMKMDPSGATSLEHVILGGEPCAHEALVRWSKRGIEMTIAYGPTEATICTSMHRFDARDPRKSPIGRPMEHVRYRVDPETGELLISGPSLAIGYHNRPDLTGERFIDGWFRTGDRVSQREDGSYDFLGRIDRQFKSRGVLIAPEEIEAALVCIPGVTRAAVILEKAEIVAFIEAEHSIDDVVIRSRLLERLPASMIPRRIIRKEEIPATTSGKPRYDALATTTDAAETLRGLFASVLALDPRTIADDADFFHLGGDSFAVLDLVASARVRGIALSAATIFERRRLDQIQASAASPEMTFGHLRSEVEARSVPPCAALRFENRFEKSRSARQILLTGATGFLGGRILRHLLERHDLHRLYCLVRGDDRSRVATTDPRVVVVTGADLSVPRLGLGASLLEELSSAITDVFHLGAAVDMVRPYSLLAPTNVDGTITILQLAEAARARLHYASTLSVFVHTDRASGVHREDDDLSTITGDTRVYGGYAQTKVAAEIAVRRSPISSTIHRFGLLTADAEPFDPPRGCHLDLFLRELQRVGSLPPGIEVDVDRLRVDITPIDFAARAMIHLAFNAPSNTPRTFHIANPRALSLREILASYDGRTGTAESSGVLLLSLLRRTSTDLFLATDCDFDTARTAKLLRDDYGLACPPAASILEAYLRAGSRR